MRNERVSDSIRKIKDTVVGTTAMGKATRLATATLLTVSGCFQPAGGPLQSTDIASLPTNTLFVPTNEPTLTQTPSDMPTFTESPTIIPTTTETPSDTPPATIDETEVNQFWTDSVATYAPQLTAIANATVFADQLTQSAGTIAAFKESKTYTPSATDTQTPEPTTTLTPTPQKGMIAEAVVNHGAGENIAQAAQGSTPEPMATPEIPVIATVEAADPDTIQRRERPINECLNIAADPNTQANQYLQEVAKCTNSVDQYDTFQNTTGTYRDSNTTSLINPPKDGDIANLGKGVILPDFQNEYGLDFTLSLNPNPVTEFDAVDSNVKNVVVNLDGQQAEVVGRIEGYEDDTLPVYEAAAAIRIVEKNGPGSTQEITSDQIRAFLVDPNNAQVLTSTVEEIYGQAQLSEEEVSKEETDRRASGNSNDGDNVLKEINPNLPLHSDQVVTCFVQLKNTDDTRPHEAQYLVKGKFESIASGISSSPTLRNGNRRPVQWQISSGFTKVGKFVWGIRRHDEGGYKVDSKDIYNSSSSGDETRPCYSLIPTLAPTIIPTADATFIIPNSFVPFETPKPGETQPPYTLVVPNLPTTAPTETPGVGVQTLIPATSVPATEVYNTPPAQPTSAPVTPTPGF